MMRAEQADEILQLWVPFVAERKDIIYKRMIADVVSDEMLRDCRSELKVLKVFQNYIEGRISKGNALHIRKAKGE